jgi:DNA-directed RNA polymerase specialized sigma24 family protein
MKSSAQRLFTLQPVMRRCFVLRTLLGLSPEVCAELLDISISEFEDELYGALTQLPFLQFTSM